MDAVVEYGTRTVIVKRGSTTLTSPSTFIAGEALTVTVSSTQGEQVLESTGGARFDSGLFCSTSGNYRFIGGLATIVMPLDTSAIVNIWGGFALSYGQLAITSNTFTLSNKVVLNSTSTL